MKAKAYFISKGQVRPCKTWGLYWEFQGSGNCIVEHRIATFASEEDMLDFARDFNFPLAEHIKKELGLDSK